MMKIQKVLSLLNFSKADPVKDNSQLFLDELSWMEGKLGALPTNALFISYAYKGNDYPTFFKDVSEIFDKKGITLYDITQGTASISIANAPMIVVCGGDIMALTDGLNRQTTASFDPYSAIKERVDSGIPYFGWNEGANIVSPEYLNPEDGIRFTALKISPFQIVGNFDENDTYHKLHLEKFLQDHSYISKSICQVDRPSGSSIRLEESGSGMIDSPGGTSPRIVKYSLLNGRLTQLSQA